MTLFDALEPDPERHHFVPRWDGLCAYAACARSAAHPVHLDADAVVLDAREGQRRAVEGEERAERHRRELAAALDDACHQAALDNDYLCADQVWVAYGEPPDTRGAASALGGAMKRAVAAGWMTPTGDFRLSARPVAHRKPLPVYQSMIHRGGSA